MRDAMPTRRPAGGDDRSVLRIVILYMLFSAAWIALTDRVVQNLQFESVGPLPLQTIKGWGFVVVSAAFLYWVIHRELVGRREAQAALQESEFRFRELIENASDIIHVVDVTDRIRYMSPSVHRALGYTPEEMVGRLSGEFVHQDDVGIARSAFAEAIERPGTTKRFELRLRHKTAGWRTFEIIGKTILEPTGQPIGIVNSRDVTDERRAEEERQTLERQLHQSQKMEAIGRLAGGVAHDFNNVLTVITGYVNLLIERFVADEDASADLLEVRKAAGRASTLTRQLLAFSRQQVLQPKVLALNAVVGDMEKMLRPVLGEDIEFVTALDPELGFVKADPGQVEQVVMNLAVNARAAMPEGGRLLIESRNANLDGSYERRLGYPVKPGRYVMLAVSDTGTGMDAEVQERIFEPFFTTKETGTGLGLSTVYGIVKQSGGYVWAYSEPGVGTTFKVYLPRVEQELLSAVEDAGDVRNVTHVEDTAGRETILVVEDDATVRATIRRSLENFGYAVVEAAGGAEALELARIHEGSLGLVVTDVVMPEMGGRRLADLLRDHLPGTPVLLISGYTEAARMRAEVLDPDTPFLQKPFSPAELAEKVRAVLAAPSQPMRLRTPRASS